MRGIWAPTKRQMQALKLRQEGKLLREIADELGITSPRAREMILAAMDKLDRLKRIRIDATQPDDPPRGVWLEK